MTCEIRLSDNANAGIKHRNNYNKPDWKLSPKQLFLIAQMSKHFALFIRL
jgi:hypothetical protein